MKTKYNHLLIQERETIAVLMGQGKSLRSIAKCLARSHSSISRELKRYKKSVHVIDYLPHRAQLIAKKRKIKAGKRMRLKDEKILEYVIKKINCHWSPEQISGRIKINYPGLSISHEAIYQYIYTERPELIPHLPRRHKNRHAKRPWDRHKNLRVPNRTMIDKRPLDINERLELGHWESDSMCSKIGSSTTANVLVERKTRLIEITKMANITSKNTKEAIIGKLSKYPKEYRLSITYDNGKENKNHEAINKALNTKSYFCWPYRSWEKGTVENTIGLVRRFIPKGSDLKNVSIERFNEIEDLLNNRPRKCLNYQTPKEAYQVLSGALDG